MIDYFLILSAFLFCVGLYGIMAKRNIIMILLSAELMLNAANLNLVTMAKFITPNDIKGQVFAIFVMVVAAAEVGVGLAILILLRRQRQSINADEIDSMKW